MPDPNLLNDPRIISGLIVAVVAVFVAIFSNLIVPIFINWRKEKKSRRNLMRMIYEDINERVTQLNNTVPGLSTAIFRAQRENEYFPVIIHTSGEDYLNLKEEKWLVPEAYSRKIVKFYSQSKGLVDLTNFFNTEQFKSLSKDRKINVLKTFEERMKESSKTGTSLLLLIKADGWIKK